MPQLEKTRQEMTREIVDAAYQAKAAACKLSDRRKAFDIVAENSRVIFDACLAEVRTSL